MNPLLTHDHTLLKSRNYLIGVDEAGRGCLAGPVVAGACVLSSNFFESDSALERSALINDSKQLTPSTREAQYQILLELRAEGVLDFEVAEGTVEEIAKWNILGATRLAMRRALEAIAGRAGNWALPLQASAGPLFDSNSEVKIIVDGRPLKPFPYEHQGIVKGDGASLVIAMASVAAKVSRDRSMLKLAQKYPAYGLEQHKGYATEVHREAILRHGPCGIHRELFLRKIIGKTEGP